MLGLCFRLTAAQTEVLIVIANECYRQIDNGPILPDYESPYFITTVNRLIALGLVTHSVDEKPTFKPTDEGKAVAKIVESHCERLLSHRQHQSTVLKNNGKRVSVDSCVEDFTRKGKRNATR